MPVLEVCVIVLVAGASCIVAIVCYRRYRPKDGTVPPPSGEYLRKPMIVR